MQPMNQQMQNHGECSPSSRPPMKVPSSVVFLPCSDIRETTRFYHEVLGLPIAQRQGESLCIFDTGCGYWGFCQYEDGRSPLSGAQGVCLSINLEHEEDVKARYEALKDQCSIYRMPSWHPKFPVFSFFVLDPDGYLVEFQKVV